MTDYVSELDYTEEAITLETRVTKISKEAVFLRPEVLFAGQLVWSGIETEVPLGASLSLSNFTMTDEFRLISTTPVELGEHYDKDKTMQ